MAWGCAAVSVWCDLVSAVSLAQVTDKTNDMRRQIAAGIHAKRAERATSRSEAVPGAIGKITAWTGTLAGSMPAKSHTLPRVGRSALRRLMLEASVVVLGGGVPTGVR